MARSCCPSRACTSRPSFAGFELGFLFRVAAASIGFCYPTGFRSFIIQPQLPRPGVGTGCPLVSVKTFDPADGSPGSELFCDNWVEWQACRMAYLGGCLRSTASRICSGGIFVNISISCTTPAISTSICAGAIGQPSLWRCLCCGYARGAGPGPQGLGYGRFHEDRALPVVYENLGFCGPKWQTGRQRA